MVNINTLKSKAKKNGPRSLMSQKTYNNFQELWPIYISKMNTGLESRRLIL